MVMETKYLNWRKAYTTAGATQLNVFQLKLAVAGSTATDLLVSTTISIFICHTKKHKL